MVESSKNVNGENKESSMYNVLWWYFRIFNLNWISRWSSRQTSLGCGLPSQSWIEAWRRLEQVGTFRCFCLDRALSHIISFHVIWLDIAYHSMIWNHTWCVCVLFRVWFLCSHPPWSSPSSWWFSPPCLHLALRKRVPAKVDLRNYMTTAPWKSGIDRQNMVAPKSHPNQHMLQWLNWRYVCYHFVFFMVLVGGVIGQMKTRISKTWWLRPTYLPESPHKPESTPSSKSWTFHKCKHILTWMQIVVWFCVFGLCFTRFVHPGIGQGGRPVPNKQLLRQRRVRRLWVHGQAQCYGERPGRLWHDSFGFWMIMMILVHFGACNLQYLTILCCSIV